MFIPPNPKEELLKSKIEAPAIKAPPQKMINAILFDISITFILIDYKNLIRLLLK